MFADGLDAKLDALLAPLAQSKVACSAAVLDAVTGERLFALNSDQALIPASNQKILVMAAAVETLGPDFVFRTGLARSGNDLVVVGSGDPGFGDPKLAPAPLGSDPKPFDAWIQRMVEMGAQVVPGDLVLDESIFDQEWTHPHWKPEALQRWYAAPVGGLNINDNCFDITVIPPQAKGGKFTWEAIPPTQDAVVELLCKWGKGEPVLNRIGREFHYQVTGRCSQRHRFVAVAAPDPGALFGDAFRTALEQRGLKVRGQIRRVFDNAEISTRSLTPIAEYSTPLPHVLARIGKDSQNMFAEALGKRLGYEWATKNAERGTRNEQESRVIGAEGQRVNGDTASASFDPLTHEPSDPAFKSEIGNRKSEIEKSADVESDISHLKSQISNPDSRLQIPNSEVENSENVRGSWTTARRAIEAYVKQLSASDHPAIRSTRWDTLVWDDASGLSRHNRVSADQLTAILSYMQSHAYGELFMNSLSEAGVDGSLSKRSRLKPLAGALFGKTGTLDGVRSLSGYLETKSGRRLAFAIILNEQGKPSKKPMTEITDEFCQILYEWTEN